MELVALKSFDKLYNFAGWFSVLCGIVLLVFLNLSFLTDFYHSFGLAYQLFILFNLVSGGIAILKRGSRSLGIWGIAIGLFTILFIGAIFTLGWMVYPFP
ncbi:hypothetical protein [Rummeliibacillus pycnus]|uniref:hypothetical protein n=1 Tax=Rummeliibacillus pycnus TaxID=101070 RepID=UPI003D2C20FD